MYLKFCNNLIKYFANIQIKILFWIVAPTLTVIIPILIKKKKNALNKIINTINNKCNILV